MTQTPQQRTYDLEERTAVFGERIIVLCKSLKKDVIAAPLVNQLIRSATSIGANYMEANGASSKKDFAHKIFICKKEAQESRIHLNIHGLARVCIFVRDADAQYEAYRDTTSMSGKLEPNMRARSSQAESAALQCI